MSSIRKRVNEVRSSSLPLQSQVAALLDLGNATLNMTETLFIHANADFVSDIMINRNVEASALERLGQQDKAIALYEANLRDQFKGLYPYERLRVLYASSGRFQDAKRVSQAFLDHGETDATTRASYRDWVTEYEGRF